MRVRRTSSLWWSLILWSVLPHAAHPADAMEPTLPGVGQSGPPFPQTGGAELYAAICQACHMPDGAGARGAAVYPALAKDPRLRAKAFPITRVLNGSKAMPAFRDLLTDAQVATVVSYVRTHFDNHYGAAVSSEDVRALRQ